MTYVRSHHISRMRTPPLLSHHTLAPDPVCGRSRAVIAKERYVEMMGHGVATGTGFASGFLFGFRSG